MCFNKKTSQLQSPSVVRFVLYFVNSAMKQTQTDVQYANASSHRRDHLRVLPFVENFVVSVLSKIKMDVQYANVKHLFKF